MAGCDNNCDAVAGLHEAAANLIQYSKLIESWLYGAQDQTVDVGGVTTPTLLNLINSIRQLVGVWPDGLTIRLSPDKKIYVPLDPNGGVKVGSNGLYTDFSDLPQDKLDEILKSLCLPIWLTANTNFYVDTNSAAASDTLDEGRGLSASKPFKTIQACVSYICANYNFDKYSVTINVAPGTYARFSVPSYTSSGGTLNIVGDSTNKPIISAENSVCVTCSETNVTLRNLKLKVQVTRTSSGSVTSACLNVGKSSDVRCTAINFSLEHLSGSGNSIHTSWLIHSDSYSIVTLGPGSDNTDAQRTSLEFHHGGYGSIVVLYASNNGIIYLQGNNDYANAANCVSSGECNTFATAAGGGSIAVYSTKYSHQYAFTIPENGSVTGKRYVAQTGGTINVGGAGANYFPGDVAGTVDAATYSWYK